jgi:hypothetical protein
MLHLLFRGLQGVSQVFAVLHVRTVIKVLALSLL